MKTEPHFSLVLQLLIFFLLLLVALFPEPAAAFPSKTTVEGSSILWKVGDVSIWRFPICEKDVVLRAAERFDAAFAKGFSLRDIRVAQKDGMWTLSVGEDEILRASTSLVGPIPLNPRLVALFWVSKLYEAAASLAPVSLEARHKIHGDFKAAGSVSWYGGHGMNGARLADGERYDETQLIAAAQSLPFGTLVRVLDPASGKSVVVRIVDRFMEHKGRLLDLSKAAADLLGISRKGIAKVMVEVLGSVPKVGGK